MAQRGTNAGYEFAQPPSAVPPRRKVYRDPLETDASGAQHNIMYDKRVVRGNTYAAHVLPPSAQAELSRSQATKSQRKAQMTQSQSREQAPPRTPPAVDGRRHTDVQTETFLEELSDRPPEVDQSTQTEAFMDRPPSPLFVPAKRGKDATTQIQPGDLFHFDAEVEPILEVLVGKTLEQSLMEVLQEEELENIRKHQEEFEQLRNAELAEVQRMEEELRRREAEKQRRKNQEVARVKAQAEAREKVAAREFAKNYLNNLQSSVLNSLMNEGHFSDPLTAEVEDTFMPFLLQVVQARVSRIPVANQLADDVICGALAISLSRLEAENKIRAEARAKAEAEAAAEAERLRLEAEAKAKAAAEAAAAAAAAGEGAEE